MNSTECTTENGRDAATLEVFSAEVSLSVNGPHVVPTGQDQESGWLEFSRRLLRFGALEEMAAETARRAVEFFDVLFCRVMVVQANQALVAAANYDRRQGGTSPDLIKPVPASTQVLYQRLLTPPVQPFTLRQGAGLSHGERWALGLPGTGVLGLAPIVWNGEALGLLICGQETELETQRPLQGQAGRIAELAEIAAAAFYRVILERRLQANRLETVLALARVLEARDIHTAGQGQRMMDLAERVALRLGFPAAELETVRWAALLHDIGMISVPDELMKRAGALMPEEWMVLRRHPQTGAEIVSAISDLAAVAELILCHHERYDGRGYPRAIAGEHIPLGSRIIAVVDAYCGMIDGRSYRPQISPVEAVEELRRCSGKNFDPRVVEAFLTLSP